LAAALFAGLTLLAWLGLVLQGKGLIETLLFGKPLGRQVAIGLTLGAAISGLGLWIAFAFDWFRGYRNVVRGVYAEIQPTSWDLIYIALGAGWSEELFFRGMLQPLVGIWIAALLFWLVHGAFSLRHWGINLYGVSVFTAGVGLGYLFEATGLVAAMCAHFALDLVTLVGFQVWIEAEKKKPS